MSTWNNRGTLISSKENISSARRPNDHGLLHVNREENGQNLNEQDLFESISKQS